MKYFFTFVQTKYLKSLHFTHTAHLKWICHSSSALGLLAIMLDTTGIDQQSAFYGGCFSTQIEDTLIHRATAFARKSGEREYYIVMWILGNLQAHSIIVKYLKPPRSLIVHGLLLLPDTKPQSQFAQLLIAQFAKAKGLL